MNHQKQICFRFLILFALGNAVLFWLIGLRYLFTITPLALNVPTTGNYILVWSYLLLAFIGHFGLLAFLTCTPIIPLFFLRNIPPRLLINCCLMLESIAIFFLIVDSFVFAQFRFHLNGVIWQMISSGEMQQIFNLSGLELALACLTILVILLIEYLYGCFL